MKKLLLLALACLGSMGGWAQPALKTSNPLNGGEFYIYHPKSGTFLTSDNSNFVTSFSPDVWTVVSKNENDGVYTVNLYHDVGGSNYTYNIEKKSSLGKTTYSNKFAEGTKETINLKTSSTNGAYKIFRNDVGLYVNYDGKEYSIWDSEYETNDWWFVSKNDYEDYVKQYTSYMSKSLNTHIAWTPTEGVNTANDIFIGGTGWLAQCEKYQWSCKTGDMATLSLRLPNGKYHVKMYCQACYANGVGDHVESQENSTVLKIEDQTQNIPVQVESASSNVTPQLYTFNNVTVADGELNICIYNNDASANWFTFRLVSIDGEKPANVANVNESGAFLYTTDANGNNIAIGVGANWGTEASCTNANASSVDIATNQYISTIKFGDNKFLFNPDEDNLYTDNTNNNKFYFIESGTGYKIVYVNDPTKAVGFGTHDIIGEYADRDNLAKDIVFDVAKLVPTASAPTWYIGSDYSKLTVSDTKYGTFVAPYDITLPDGVNAYTISSVSDNTVTLSDAITGILTANTPVIVKGTPGTTTFYGPASANTTTGSVLVGILQDNVNVPANSYVLQTQDEVQKFFKVSADAKGKKNRCYLAASAGVKVLNLVTEEEETSIENILNEETGSKDIYDLSGRKVNNAQKGIYIVNGRKVLVK